MIFRGGATEVTCDRAGRVTSVVHESNPGLSYLSGAAIGTLVIDGLRLEPPAPDVSADVDEVELSYTYPDRLRLVVRHAFAPGWGLRLAFTSLATTAQWVERALIRLEPEPDFVAWALTLGVTGAYALSPASGTGPLLGGSLRRGSLSGATAAGLELSPFALGPGGRYLVQLHWDWYQTPQAFGHKRCAEAPSALVVTAGDSVLVEVDEDVAVIAPPGLETAQTADRLEVLSHLSGTFPFELRSSRGTTIFDLQWVDSVEERLADLASEGLAQPRTPAGVIKLAGVAEALVVQHALALNRVGDPDDATEALDLFTARLDRLDNRLGPLEAVYLCREYDRLGEVSLLSQAASAIRSQSEPLPGLGIAATQLCLGLIVTGRPIDDVLRHLLRLVETLSSEDPYAARRVAAQTAALEIIAVTHAGPGVAGAISSPLEVTPRIAALGLHLGAGMPGRAVTPLPVSELSHLITVFQLLPDGPGAQLEPLWGCSAQALARRATPELLARLDHEPIGDAHAWLVLALQTG